MLEQGISNFLHVSIGECRGFLLPFLHYGVLYDIFTVLYVFANLIDIRTHTLTRKRGCGKKANPGDHNTGHGPEWQ